MNEDSRKSNNTDNYLREYHEKLKGLRDFNASSQHNHQQIIKSENLQQSHEKNSKGF